MTRSKSPGGPKIYAAMISVMKEIGVVGKNHENPNDGYAYRSADDVVAAVKPLLVKHGVLMVPEVVGESFLELAAPDGSALFRVWVKVRHTFYAKDSSSVSATTLGEAIDSGDKGTGAAQTTAMKYALTEVFQIATREPGRDVEESSPEVKPSRAAATKEKKESKAAKRDRAALEAALEAAFPGREPVQRSWLVVHEAGTQENPYSKFLAMGPLDRYRMIAEARKIGDDLPEHLGGTGVPTPTADDT